MPGENKFEAPSRGSGLADLVRVVESRAAVLADSLHSFVHGHAELSSSFRAISVEHMREHTRALVQLVRSESTGVDEMFTAWAELSLERKIELDACQAAVAVVRGRCTQYLIHEYAASPQQLSDALGALELLADRMIAAVVQAHLRSKDRLLDEQQKQTAQAKLRFDRLAESGILGVIICDLDGNILEANDGFLAMVGYTRQELISGEIRWSAMTPPEWASLDIDAIEQLKTRGMTRPWEKEYFRKDGSRVPILVGVAMLNDHECVAFVLDISERKRIEELRARSVELEAENHRIQEANRLKSEFLANMSHELRTPLNSIIGFADILHEGEVTPDSPEHGELLRDILKSGRHLLKLINDVLDLAKVEAGKLEFMPEPLDLTKSVSEVCSVLRATAAGKGIRLEQHIDEEVNELTLDPSRLKQVLYNYLSNALKFTPEGGSVTVLARAEGSDAVRLEVVDTGVGIAASDLGRLFVEFQQLDAGVAKKHAGTGLGLALTKRIVEAQQGSVGVKSVVGQGSTFFAVLPRHHPPAIGGAEPVTFVQQRIEGASTVLVVEDDPRDRSFLVQTLSREGFGVKTAATGMEAIHSCAERAFSAITLDLLLPDITGLEVLRRVRTEGQNRETPVVIVSVVAEKGVLGGFPVHDYLQKPIERAELIDSLERASVTPGRVGTILVIDDDPAALKIAETMLQRFDYKVATRADGASGLEFARREPPMAVILDLLMPGMDGFEFLAHFRELRGCELVPVIVWTIKDLTTDDYVRLQRLAHAVVGKSGESIGLLKELAALLSKTPAIDRPEGR